MNQKTQTTQEEGIFAGLNRDTFDHTDPADYMKKFKKGISSELVAYISKDKDEPEWMLHHRMKAYEYFTRIAMPKWGPSLDALNFDEICFFAKAADKKGGYDSWDKVPSYIKNTFDRLGIPEAEKKFLGGVGAQYESEVVYHSLRDDLAEMGIIFLGMDTALKEQEDLVKKYFSTIIPADDNKFAALNSAVWSGGSFIYIPKGVKTDVPLQAYFRINGENIGQFERTLIICDEYSRIHYIEGCTAPVYSSESLHCAVVELVAHKGAHLRYTTIQNWSKNIYNLVTKRAYAYEDACVEWVDGNLGSLLTMKYPSVYLLGKRAKAEIISVAFAGEGRHQDAGGKVVHLASDTTSRITSKSISKDGGRSTYRGLIHVAKGATGVKSSVRCDALLMDDISRTDTYPYNEINEQDCTITHEASVGKIGEDRLFYLMSRGISEIEALNMIVMGFFSPFTKELPMEYSVELNRLMQMEMEGAVG
ncbi:MAG: Fe-S cluster assembly protein SufB [Thaumarchaeota archaeon]|nr:Fe-S cluster assembly protein SufB [Nitrososphaerota archaeon]